MSLRWSIALAMGLLVAVATVAAGAVGYRTTRATLYAEVDKSLATAAGSLGPGAFDGPRGPGPPHRARFDEYAVQRLGSDGAVDETTFDMAAAPSDRARSVVGRPERSVTETVTVDGTTYRVRTAGSPDGAVQVARNLDETNRVLSSLRARVAFMVVAITAGAVAIGLFIAGGLTGPLRRLTAAADTVSETGRLDLDVPAGGRDEVGRLSGAFGRMLGALARSRDEQQRLVQDAGHELRTPLTSLRTNLDVLRRYGDLPANDRAAVVNDLHAETEELVTLVNELVTVASGATGDERCEEIPLGTLARQLAERYERRTGRPVAVQTDESVVVAPRGQLARAISNLLDNASKFDVSGGPIEMRVATGRLEVADHGIGIDAADRDLVFRRFHRAAEARSLPGSGLGLSIVYDVVTANGGTVFASARHANAAGPPGSGPGAVVGFQLPTLG